jgi:hypothetical protein
MIIPRKEDLHGLAGVPKGSIKDIKQAVVFATLGIPLDPVNGILVLCRQGADRLDGEAYFTFNVPQNNFERIQYVYALDKADVELDAMLDRIKADSATAGIGAELERMISDALIIYGRRFLENYQRMTSCLMSKGKDIEIREKDIKRGAYQFVFKMEKRR